MLFVDVVGSTDFLVRAGDTDGVATLGRLEAALARGVEAAGGTVVKGLGDGVMAVFESVKAALDCAISLQRRTDLDADGDEPLALRVGVSLGEVTREGDDYRGITVVEAARLCAAADASQILTTQVALSLSRVAIAYRSVGPLVLKGLAGPIEAVEILWREGDDPGPARHGSVSPGRRMQLAALVGVIVVVALVAWAVRARPPDDSSLVASAPTGSTQPAAIPIGSAPGTVAPMPTTTVAGCAPSWMCTPTDTMPGYNLGMEADFVTGCRKGNAAMAGRELAFCRCVYVGIAHQIALADFLAIEDAVQGTAQLPGTTIDVISKQCSQVPG